MTECSKFRQWLLASEDEVPMELGGDYERHLSTCSECRQEHSGFQQLLAAMRLADAGRQELPSPVRRRIAVEAAAGARRRGWSRWLPVLGLELSSRPGAVALAAASLVALLALPVLRHEVGPTPKLADDTRLVLVADRGVVRIAWSDGVRRSYTVFKSSDPRTIGRGEAHVVTGNTWVDRQPDSSPVVFYRIE